MVNAVEQCLDGVGKWRRIKAQQHFDWLGQLDEFDLVDDIVHALVEPMGVCRGRNSIFGVGKYHVAQEHRCHELTVREAAGRIPCLAVGLLAHRAFWRADDPRPGTHRPIGAPYRNLANAGVGLIKNQLHIGIIGQRRLANGAVHLVHFARNAHVA